MLRCARYRHGGTDSGRTPSDAALVIGRDERAAAETAVAALIGVRNIKNDIDISWDADPIDVILYVQNALDQYALIPDDSDVMVDLSGNTVTLTGHVRARAEHDAVLEAAWMAPGVYYVDDRLHISG